MTFAVAPSPYLRSACTTTAVSVTPSAAALAFAASSTSVGMRNGVVGVFAMSGGPRAELLRALRPAQRRMRHPDEVVDAGGALLRRARDLTAHSAETAAA